MKVCFYFPATRLRFQATKKSSSSSFEYHRGISGGGPLVKTKNAMENINVETQLFDQWHPQSDFDIFFVHGSKYQLRDTIKAIKMINKKVVLVTGAYSWRPLWHFRAWSFVEPFLPIPTIYGLRKEIYEMADILIPQSESEKIQIYKSFHISKEKFRVVPYGIDEKLFGSTNPDPFIEEYEIENFVLQVARINRRKGQTRLIEALDETGEEIVFVGQLDEDEPEEVEKFLSMVEERPWVHYIGRLEHDSLLPSAYAAANVHVLPSTYEFPGVVSLEAAAAGCAVVSGPYPPIKDYLGDRITYCDPEDPESIRKATMEARVDGPDESLAKYVLDNFTWAERAKRLKRIFDNMEYS